MPSRCEKRCLDALAKEWGNKELLSYTKECTLEELEKKFALILQGKLKGRTVVKIYEKAA